MDPLLPNPQMDLGLLGLNLAKITLNLLKLFLLNSSSLNKNLLVLPISTLKMI
jgi:hypothetical protein